MKAIMISIKPKWCAKIMNGEKTIEVRKNKALASAIQKLIDENGYADIYVCCSKGKYEMGKFNSDKKYHEIRDDCSYAGGWLRGLPDETVNGKVVFKFRCYNVEEISLNRNHFVNEQYSTDELDYEELLETSCLSYAELDNYLQCEIGYAIHISDLEIFDRPKELNEYKKYYRSKGYPQNQSWYLTKAPQNMVYIEIIKGGQ